MSASTARKSAKSAPARVVPTMDAPLPSGWVRQSTVPLSEELAVSRFTTQTQRKLLRAIVKGEVDSAADLPMPTLRTIERLKGLKLITVAKSGAVKATAAGETFVAERSPAPVIRTAPKPAAKAPAKTAKATPAKKTTKRVVKRAAK